MFSQTDIRKLATSICCEKGAQREKIRREKNRTTQNQVFTVLKIVTTCVGTGFLMDSWYNIYQLQKSYQDLGEKLALITDNMVKLQKTSVLWRTFQSGKA